jgi:hypothetical protein
MYIPELTSLCARELARQAREMSQEDRYNFLRSIPPHLRLFVKAFPTDFLVWCGNESIMNTNIVRHHPKDRKWFKSYERCCREGITRRKVFLRKCANYYCDDWVFGCIIVKNYNIRYNCCNLCIIPPITYYLNVRIGISD